jgi:uncharacterized protein
MSDLQRDGRTPVTGTSVVLDEQQCWDLLDGATVGRVGLVHDGRVLIIPTNYLLQDRSVLIRTSPDGVLGTLAGGADGVAFEVDYHDGGSGTGWSVLLSGSVRGLTEAEIAELPQNDRVLPWAGGTRDLRLRFTPAEVSGRRVRRRRN